MQEDFAGVLSGDPRILQESSSEYKNLVVACMSFSEPGGSWSMQRASRQIQKNPVEPVGLKSALQETQELPVKFRECRGTGSEVCRGIWNLEGPKYGPMNEKEFEDRRCVEKGRGQPSRTWRNLADLKATKGSTANTNES